MVDVNEQKILQLAKQGNLQAIAVMLNRHLISEGVHIKVKSNSRCLQILLKAPEGRNQSAVLQILQQQMTHLGTQAFDIVKVYTPQPGTQTANLLHSFELSSTVPSPVLTSPSPVLTPPSPSAADRNGNSAPGTTENRVSVATFLAQVTNLEDLKALKSHPFFTGQCPECGSKYQHKELPLFWDCSNCNWRDDLSAIMPPSTQNNNHNTAAEMKRLGNYLMEAGLLSESQINVALADQEITGMRLGEALVRRGWVKEETIEYLMKKVILPERQHMTEADLEVSRNLVQALLKQGAEDAQASTGTYVVPQPSHIETQTQKKKPIAIPNERATLVLPDLDISEHLEDYLAQ